MGPEQSGSHPLSKEQMRLECEILKLRLQAEYGTHFPDPYINEIDPVPEYTFLMQVLELYQRFISTAPLLKLSQVLDFGQFPPVDVFSDDEALTTMLWDAIDYLEENHVFVEFDHSYPDRVMYAFLMVELPGIEIIGRPSVNNSICILYEAIHPNLKAEAAELAEDFFDSLMPGDLPADHEMYFCLRRLPARLRTNTVTELLELSDEFLSCFAEISYWTVQVDDTVVDITPDPAEHSEGIASVSGTLTYTVSLSDGSRQEIDAPFRVDMWRDAGFWYVSDFEFRGFVWPLKA